LVVLRRLSICAEKIPWQPRKNPWLVGVGPDAAHHPLPGLAARPRPHRHKDLAANTARAALEECGFSLALGLSRTTRTSTRASRSTSPFSGANIRRAS